MAIGTSDGSVYENDFEHAAAQHDPTLDKNRIDVYKGNPPDTKDNNVVAPAPTNDNNVQTPTEMQKNIEINRDPKNITNDSGSIVDYDLQGKGPKTYETPLTPEEEPKFQEWKQKFAPNDSGADYDLRGAYKAGLEPDATTGHWPDTFKKPNHPTFSDQSMYVKDRPDLAGSWNGDTYIPPRRPLGSPTEPRGALESPGSTNTPEKVLFRTSSPLVNITDADIDTAINVGMGAGPGTMQGIKSLTFDRAALTKAQEMHANNAHPEDIHAATGTFQGADSRWRQEIDDSKAVLNPKAFDSLITPATSGSDGMGKATMGWGDVGGHEAIHTMSLKTQVPDFFGKTKPVLLKDVLDHPELYKAYPDVGNLKIDKLPDYLKDVALGAMGSDTLYLGENLDAKFVKSLILHEAQHKIQDIEGFARGGNPMEFKSKELLAQEEKFNNAKTQTEQQIKEEYKITETQLDNLKNAIRNPESLPSDMHRRLFQHTDPDLIKRLKDVVEGENLLTRESERQSEQYRRLMGEVEARNVQKRMDMDKFERAFKPPQSTEDRPRFVQIQK